jgi:hypothetical protein
VRVAVGAGLAALVLLAAGCGGGGEAEAEAGKPVAPVSGAPAPAAGQTLLRFVEAANRRDAAGMWALLSPQTKETMGPTLPEFRRGLAVDLRNGVATFDTRPRVVLSRRIGRWAVAAVAGDRVLDDGDEEPFAYGAALRDVGGRWLVELGGIAIAVPRPAPNDEEDSTPTLGAELDASGPLVRALLWRDAEPQPAERVQGGPFSATIREDVTQPLSDGVHVVTVFATTPDTAAASAWTFEVVD